MMKDKIDRVNIDHEHNLGYRVEFFRDYEYKSYRPGYASFCRLTNLLDKNKWILSDYYFGLLVIQLGFTND